MRKCERLERSDLEYFGQSSNDSRYYWDDNGEQWLFKSTLGGASSGRIDKIDDGEIKFYSAFVDINGEVDRNTFVSLRKAKEWVEYMITIPDQYIDGMSGFFDDGDRGEFCAAHNVGIDRNVYK